MALKGPVYVPLVPTYGLQLGAVGKLGTLAEDRGRGGS